MARYLANDLSEEERTSFETKLTTDENLSSEFESYLNLWELTHQVGAGESFDSGKAWETIQPDEVRETKEVSIAPKRSFSFLKIAATILILAISGYFVFTSVNNQSQGNLIEVTSDRGVKEITLPDGSLVKLNANSTITYPRNFNSESRAVTLNGEANFDVVRNEKLPFVIEAGISRIEVLGTSFDVTAYSNDKVELNVSEGKVAFSHKGDSINTKVVTEGQKATLVADTNIIEVSENDNFNYNGWWTRKLEYVDTPLSEVLADLEKTYWVDFEYDEALADCPLTSTFENSSIDGIIEIITSTFAGIKSSKGQENKIKLSGKGCDR